MKIAVLGAGAIGSAIGGLLAIADEDVVLVGRKPHVDAINRNGLVIDGRQGGRHVPVSAAEELLVRPDIALLVVKTQDVASAVNGARHYLAGVPMLTMQNGVRSDELVAEMLGSENVVGTVVQVAADLIEPGRVNLRLRGSLAIGAAWGPNDQKIVDIAAVLDKAVPTSVVDEIRSHRWTKLIFNLVNAITAVAGVSMQALLADARLVRLLLLMTKEALVVVRHSGIELNTSLAPPHVHLLLNAVESPLDEGVSVMAQSEYAAGDPVISSTLQSILRGKTTEVDYLNGEIVRLGSITGISTPYNERLVRLVHQVETSGRFLSAEELVAATDAACCT